jgi:hypothetical protein
MRRAGPPIPATGLLRMGADTATPIPDTPGRSAKEAY